MILLAAGLALLVPGLALLGIGGSGYYAVIGLAAVGTAMLAALRKPAVALAYAVILLGTTVWGLWEVGLDPRALMPRLVFWIVGGIAVALVCAASRAERRALWVAIGSATGVFLIAWILHSPFEAGPARWSGQPRAVAATSDWAHYGNSLGGSRFLTAGRDYPDQCDRARARLDLPLRAHLCPAASARAGCRSRR